MKTLVIASILALAGCGHTPSPSYTMYRNSPLDENARVHWASFDATDEGFPKGTYNQENCSIAVDLLNANLRKLNGPNVKVRYWCEKGAYRP